MKSIKATIQNVRLARIDRIFKKHKPQGLGFSDTDVIIIEFKTNRGRMFIQNYYCRLKADGTLGHSITKASEKRQQNLKTFIEKYISKDKRYNIRDNINTWIGKPVEVEKLEKNYIVKL